MVPILVSSNFSTSLISSSSFTSSSLTILGGVNLVISTFGGSCFGGGGGGGGSGFFSSCVTFSNDTSCTINSLLSLPTVLASMLPSTASSRISTVPTNALVIRLL